MENYKSVRAGGHHSHLAALIMPASRSVPLPGALRREAPPQPLEQFAERYKQFFPRLFAYVYGRIQNAQAAEDIVSEVFERVLLKAHSLRNEEAFGTWIFTIARNLMASHGRKQARQGSLVDSDLLSTLAASSASVEGLVLQREEVAAILEHLRTFPQREQEIIALKFDAELSNRQIAKILGISEGNVRVILYRTLRKLRDLLSGAKESRL